MQKYILKLKLNQHIFYLCGYQHSLYLVRVFLLQLSPSSAMGYYREALDVCYAFRVCGLIGFDFLHL